MYSYLAELCLHVYTSFVFAGYWVRRKGGGGDRGVRRDYMRGRRGRREEGQHQILLGKLDKCILYSTVSVTVGMHFTCSVEKVQDKCICS